MIIEEIQKRSVWESFLVKCEEKTFLQSWNWGEFQKLMGHRIWRLGLFAGDQLLSLALLTKIAARRGTYLLCQHGPTIENPKLQIPNSKQIKNFKSQILKTFSEKLRVIAKEEKASFARINPLWEKSEENQKIFKEEGFIESPLHANAYTATWKLDLAPDEDALLRGMRKTTRYLIRQALANPDVKVEMSNKIEDAAAYQRLNLAVAQKQSFTPFSFEHVKNEFAAFLPNNQVLWFFGRHRGEVVAGALVIFWQNLAFYHQAASCAKDNKLNLPYLIVWEAIKEAKRRNCRCFDFWGFVDPKKHPSHPWAGPALFKMGFGGKASEYLKTQDLPFTKRYWLTWAWEKMVSLKRGF